MYTSKDVCVITPTYNRPEDLEKTIKSIIETNNIPGKMVILDQSNEVKRILVEKIVKKYMKRYRFLEYEYSKIAGTNIAMNKGIEFAIKGKFKFVCIIADDVEILKGFWNNVMVEFNSHPKTIGVGAIQIEPPINYNSLKFKLKKTLLNFFLLPTFEERSFRITGPYGNTSALHVDIDIKDCEWMPGFINCYKIELYDNYRIPERIGYDVLSDIDMGYYTYRKYGKGSLVIPSNVRAYHHMSPVERYPNKKRIFVNHEDHITFYYHYYYNFTGTLKLFWELWWINILNIGRSLIIPKKENFLKVGYLWQALFYCFKYRKQIKEGKSRMFLNPDLSFNENW